jgi:hypothetical protein
MNVTIRRLAGCQARTIDDAGEGDRRIGRFFQTKQCPDGEKLKRRKVLDKIPDDFDIA